MTDEQILEKLKAGGKRSVTHTVTDSGKHVVRVVWFGGWNCVVGADADYAVALRTAAVGVMCAGVPIPHSTRSQMVARMLPEADRQAYLDRSP